MPLLLDHIVIAVHRLETAIADYSALGFNVLRGGDHPGRTSHNALVVFADGSYFELIAFKEPSPQEPWWQLLQRHGEGIVDYALLPQSTAATVAAAAQRGLALDGPRDGGRLRPDGERLQWQTARPSTRDLPFLCGDITPRALRVPEGDARVHPNGALGVASLTIAVQDLDASLVRYRALMGDKADGLPVGTSVTLPESGLRIAVIELGGSALVLVQALDARSEGPRAIVLRKGGAAPDRGPLDPALAHGAPIEFAR